MLPFVHVQVLSLLGLFLLQCHHQRDHRLLQGDLRLHQGLLLVDQEMLQGLLHLAVQHLHDAIPVCCQSDLQASHELLHQVVQILQGLHAEAVLAMHQNLPLHFELGLEVLVLPQHLQR